MGRRRLSGDRQHGEQAALGSRQHWEAESIGEQTGGRHVLGAGEEVAHPAAQLFQHRPASCQTTRCSHHVNSLVSGACLLSPFYCKAGAGDAVTASVSSTELQAMVHFKSARCSGVLLGQDSSRAEKTMQERTERITGFQMKTLVVVRMQMESWHFDLLLGILI